MDYPYAEEWRMRARTYDWDLEYYYNGKKRHTEQYLKQTIPGMMCLARSAAIKNPYKRVKMVIASRHYDFDGSKGWGK